LAVVRVEAGWRQGVGDGARVRALVRMGASGWALGERDRTEPVFGRVQGVYGSSVGFGCGCLACGVAWLGVSGGGDGLGEVWVLWLVWCREG